MNRSTLPTFSADAAIEADRVRSAVREGYAAVANTGVYQPLGATESGTQAEGGCCSGSGCCGPSAGLAADELAARIGYSAEELAALPGGSNLGLSCGNPTALAALKPGEVVLDLGSGGGFDCFIAAKKVGPTGRVIGVDMTPEMLSKARRNLASFQSGSNSAAAPVEFRLGEIEHLPLADGSVDVVISNCVINLSPDKPQVWREIARVLKPGGRVAISDIVLLRPLPEAVRTMVEALVGCVAGAALADDLRAMMEGAGLADIQLTPKSDYIGVMNDSQDPLYQAISKHLPAGTTAADFVGSMEIAARRPARAARCC